MKRLNIIKNNFYLGYTHLSSNITVFVVCCSSKSMLLYHPEMGDYSYLELDLDTLFELNRYKNLMIEFKIADYKISVKESFYGSFIVPININEMKEEFMNRYPEDKNLTQARIFA